MNEKSSHLNVAVCSECQSEYYSHSSGMQALCPECAHWLYGHENCLHQFQNGRCLYCFWNGNSSAYVRKLKAE